MPDLWMDVDAALSEVPVNIAQLIDSGDFIAREEAVTYDQAGMDLVWEFTTTAGVTTQTAVTPTTAGDYDWSHQGNAMYTIEIPASGGASINNDTEGFGQFIGFATGVLPWRGPIIGFRAAALNNALIDGGDTLDVNVTAMAAGTVTAAAIAAAAIDNATFAADVGSTAYATNIIALAVRKTLDELNLDHLMKTATGAADFTTEVADNTVLARIITSDGDTSGYDLAVDSQEAIADTLGTTGAGLTTVPWNAAWDAEVESEVTDSLIAHNLDHLMKTATAAADMTTEVTDGTVISRMITSDADTSGYDLATDSQEAIRDNQAAGGGVAYDTAQAGAASTITLAAGSSAVNDNYLGASIGIVAGTGAGQVRMITGYVGATKVATVDKAWVTNPDATSQYNVNIGGPSNVVMIKDSATVNGVALDKFTEAILAMATGNFARSGGTITVYKQNGTDTLFTAVLTGTARTITWA